VAPDNGVVDFVQTDAANAGDRVCEILVDDILANADRFKNLCALIGLNGGYAHFGGDADDAVQDSLVVIVDGGVGVLVEIAVFHHLRNTFLREIGVYSARAEAEESCEVVNVARLRAFQNDGNGRALFCFDEILLKSRNREQGRYGNPVFVHTPVGENKDVCTIPKCLVAGHEELVERQLQGGVFVIQD